MYFYLIIVFFCNIDQAYEEESLRSKYTRLGIEFKKLRERHRALKDSYKESTGLITHLESKLTDQTIHMRNLENEKESLIFRNQYLIKQAAFLEKQLEAANSRRGRPTSNGCSVDDQIHDDALKNALAEVHKLHEDVILKFWLFFEITFLVGSTVVTVPSKNSRSGVSEFPILQTAACFRGSSSFFSYFIPIYPIIFLRRWGIIFP